SITPLPKLFPLVSSAPPLSISSSSLAYATATTNRANAGIGNHRLLLAANRISSCYDGADHLHISLNGSLISLPTTKGAYWRSQSALPLITVTRATTVKLVIIEIAGILRFPITTKESRVFDFGSGFSICD
ncbi:hypothetical protein U1Q18_014996, partial [Sarracenia purpurea var. burkii]